MLKVPLSLNRHHTEVSKLGSKYKTFNPFMIAEKMNVEIRYVDFDQQPLGQATSILGDKMILLDDSLRDENLRYFVAAHELCHVVNHNELGGYYISHNYAKSKLEHEADYFAMVLLMSLYEELFGEQPRQVFEVGHTFGLTTEHVSSFF